METWIQLIIILVLLVPILGMMEYLYAKKKQGVKIVVKPSPLIKVIKSRPARRKYITRTKHTKRFK